MSIKELLKRYVRAIQFWGEFRQFSTLSAIGSKRFDIRWAERFPCLDDATTTTPFDHHYFYHTAWAARVLSETKPKRHVDISSALWFAGIASAFVPFEFYDYRPAHVRLDNLTAAAADLTKLHFPDGSIESLSCMHVVEHVGLGRYGDPIAPDADLIAMRELSRVLSPGGQLLFVTPVGRPRIQFNAHRIYSVGMIEESFTELDLVEFSLVQDYPATEGLIRNATRATADNLRYGCGCFLFRKPLET